MRHNNARNGSGSIRRFSRVISGLLLPGSIALLLGGCGTIRDSRGVVHDSGYINHQASDISHNDPLRWTIVPFALPWNAAKALPENGHVELAGTIVDEQGHPIDDVKMTIKHARLITYDLDNDEAVFNEWKAQERSDGAFHVSYFNDHMITLTFAKDGFAPVSCHLELVQHSGATPADQTTHADQNFYGESPLSQNNVVVVMKHGSAATQPVEEGE